MGEVWRAVHVDLGSSVAVKVISARRGHKVKMARGFFREARAMAGLNHPNIVHIFGYGQIEEQAASASGGKLTVGTPYLVMELADGGTLSAYRGKLGWSDLRTLLFSLLDALAHAHARGVIHKDIKPGNVLLQGPYKRVKLTDFGLAHVLDTEEVSTETPWQSFGGTPAYMAPEQFYGDNRELAPTADIYSLGCLAYTLITGGPPFGKKNWVEVANGHLYKEVPPFAEEVRLPDAFIDWVMVLLAKKPADRFECAADAAWALQQVPLPAQRDESPSFLGADDLLLPVPIDPSESTHAALGDLTTLVWLDEETREFHAKNMGTPPREVTVKEGKSALPPIPESWRHPTPKRPGPTLLGTGLNLYSARAIPMVGRQSERTALWEALRDTAKLGSVHVTCISGPAGYGVSRLSQWLSQRATELGAAGVMSASHGPLSNRRDGLAAMVARYLRVFAYPRHEVPERLRLTLLENDKVSSDEWRSLVDMVSPVVKAAPGSPARQVPSVPQPRRFELIRKMLKRACDRRALVLVLEDAHRSLEAIEFVFDLLGSEEASRLPVCVVVTVHDNDVRSQPLIRAALEQLCAMEQVSRMELGPLNEHEQKEFVDQLLPLEPALARKLVARTSGNPQFAHQLLGDWVGRGLLELGHDGFRLKPGEAVPLPASLQEAWRDTVNRVLLFREEADGLALEIAATLGLDVDGMEWRMACQMLEVRPSADLVECLFEGRLARSPQGPAVGWSFVHGMLREALEIRAKERGRLASHHQVCAKLLERLDSDGNRERRAWHYMAAGAYKKSLPLFLRCAADHIASGDIHSAHLCLDAREQALEAIDPDGLHPARASGWVLWACLWRIREEYPRSREYALKAAKNAIGVKDYETLYRAYRELGIIHILRGEPNKAMRYQMLARQAAKVSGSTLGMFDSLAEQGWIWLHRGDLVRARDCFAEAAKRFEEEGIVDSLHGCWLGLAEVARMGAQFEEAGRFLDMVEGTDEALINPWTSAASRHFKSNLAKSRDDLELAEEYMLEAGQMYAETGSAAIRIARLNRGLLLIAQDRVSTGQRLLREVLVTVAKERTPTLITLRSGLLVAAAHERSWLEWDEHCSFIINGINVSDYVNADVASLLFSAGKLAKNAGEAQRSRTVMVVSKGLYLALGRTEDAEAVSQALDATLSG